MAHNERRHFHERGKSSAGLIKPSEPRRTRGATFARNVGANILIEKEKKKRKRKEGKTNQKTNVEARRNLSRIYESTNLGRRPRVAGGEEEVETQLRESCARCALPLAFYGAVSLMKRGERHESLKHCFKIRVYTSIFFKASFLLFFFFFRSDTVLVEY